MKGVRREVNTVALMFVCSKAAQENVHTFRELITSACGGMFNLYTQGVK